MTPSTSRRGALFAVVTAAALLSAAPVAWAWSPVHMCGDAWYARWLPGALPASYSVNPAGSGLSDAEATAVVQRCFDHWFEPCCSGARATGAGTTTLSPTANGDEVSTIGFLDSSWPRDLGDPAFTLGVTLPIVWSDCHISEVDIVFNELVNDFCYSGCGARDDAFEPIATHEMGHFFGLGHSEDSSALMYYQYLGGTDGSLRADDINGICTIYPGDHCGCTGPGDCAEGLDCVDGACVPPDPCEGVSCAAGEQCVGGSCIEIGDCAVCEPCTDNGPCGPNGQCMNRGDGQGRCTQTCGPAGSCPGDSVCFRATGGGDEVFICLNPDASASGICHDGYACVDCAADGCAPGEQCFDGACRPDPTFVVCIHSDASCAGCPDAAEGCVDLTEAGSTVCTVRCVVDEDCGECGACIDTDDPRVRVCANHDIDEVGACPPDWTCYPAADGDADVDADGDADVDGDADGDGDGCACRAPSSPGLPSGVPAALAALALLVLRSRRLR